MATQNIARESFRDYDSKAMMTFLNKDEVKGNIISICQAKNNDFTIFYWRYE